MQDQGLGLDESPSDRRAAYAIEEGVGKLVALRILGGARIDIVKRTGDARESQRSSHPADFEILDRQKVWPRASIQAATLPQAGGEEAGFSQIRFRVHGALCAVGGFVALVGGL